MQDPNTKIKKAVLEPRFYALLVRSIRGQVLHTGVHFSLDEAYSAARTKMNMMARHNPGDSVDIELWNCMSAKDCLDQISDNPIQEQSRPVESIVKKEPVKNPEKTIKDTVKELHKAKNDLMKSLINQGNIDDVKKIGAVLNNNEKRLVIKKIEERQIPPNQLKG